MTPVMRPLSVGGIDAVVLENDMLRAVIVPSLGGRVWELEDRKSGRQWIWHRESVPLAPTAPGAEYDAVWAGGWEELFPNDAPGEFEGRHLPDHGEWWTLDWSGGMTAECDDAMARLTLEAETSCVRTICRKEFRLARGSSTLSVHYRVISREPQPFHFLFKQHLPVAITSTCRLVLPGGDVEAVDPAFGTLLTQPGSVPWPATTRGIDLRAVADREQRQREFVYVRNLPAGVCGVVDPAQQSALRFEFDRAAFPYVWLFLSYGGWRDTYTAVLEPCTNVPKDLAEAVRRSTSARLLPGEQFEAVVAVTLGSAAAFGWHQS